MEEKRNSLEGVLTIIFIVLKVIGVIEWSWWWVFSPLWIAFLIQIFIVVLAYMILKIIGK